MGAITVYRAPADSRDVLRAYRVVLDDVVVAALRPGEEVGVDVEPGTHSLEARIDWTDSAVVRVEIADDEVVRFRVRPIGGPFGAFRAFLPMQYLSLDRDS